MAGLLLAGCGGEAGSEGRDDAPRASAKADNEAPQQSGEDLAASLKGEIPAITKTVTITEDNDPNDSIGRPGSYTESVAIYDSRADCASDELSVDCGAKIEVFSSRDEASARKNYIQQSLKDNPILGSEYDYVLGSTLLRVSGTLKPSEAKQYEAAAD